jgi:hypothetical protein
MQFVHQPTHSLHLKSEQEQQVMVSVVVYFFSLQALFISIFRFFFSRKALPSRVQKKNEIEIEASTKNTQRNSESFIFHNHI